jgi:hypothetical protein
VLQVLFRSLGIQARDIQVISFVLKDSVAAATTTTLQTQQNSESLANKSERNEITYGCSTLRDRFGDGERDGGERERSLGLRRGDLDGLRDGSLQRWHTVTRATHQYPLHGDDNSK